MEPNEIELLGGGTVTTEPETAPKKYLSADAVVAHSTEGKDLTESDVDDVFGGSVQIRSLTAAQAAQVNQGSIKFGVGRKAQTQYSFAESERIKFRFGVVQPSFNADQVMTLHTTAGPSFQKVLKAIDELSGTDQKSADEDEESFR